MKLLICFSLTILSLALSAQDDDVSKYFDDNGLGNPKNAFKFDILQTAGGDFTISYERFLFDLLTIEVGGGFLLGTSVLPLGTILGDQEFTEERGGGYKIAITPAFHPSENSRDGISYGLHYFHRSSKDIVRGLENKTYDRKDTFIGYYMGYRNEIGDRFSWEASLSAGWIFYKTPVSETPIDQSENSDINLTLSLKIAFHQ